MLSCMAGLLLVAVLLQVHSFPLQAGMELLFTASASPALEPTFTAAGVLTAAITPTTATTAITPTTTTPTNIPTDNPECFDIFFFTGLGATLLPTSITTGINLTTNNPLENTTSPVLPPPSPVLYAQPANLTIAAGLNNSVRFTLQTSGQNTTLVLLTNITVPSRAFRKKNCRNEMTIPTQFPGYQIISGMTDGNTFVWGPLSAPGKYTYTTLDLLCQPVPTYLGSITTVALPGFYLQDPNTLINVNPTPSSAPTATSPLPSDATFSSPTPFTVSNGTSLNDTIIPANVTNWTNSTALSPSVGGAFSLFVNSTLVAASHMALLDENTVLLVSAGNGNSSTGESGSQVTTSAVLLDLTLDTVTPLPAVPDMSLPACATGAFFSDGTLAYLGAGVSNKSSNGSVVNSGVINVLSSVSGNTSTWQWQGGNTSAIPVSNLQCASAILSMDDGSLLMIGGVNSTSASDLFSSPIYQWISKTAGLMGNGSGVISFLSDPIPHAMYPFAYLLPDGNVFLFANMNAQIWNPKNNSVVMDLPECPGQAYRTYPLSGGIIALPLRPKNAYYPEFLVCGGTAAYDPYVFADGTCARLNLNGYANPNVTLAWTLEVMPALRSMPDLVTLPDGKVLILNGAQVGYAGWSSWYAHATNPNLTPVLYDPEAMLGQRFTVMNPTTIPRMDGSTAMLLPDGSVLVAGSSSASAAGVVVDEVQAERFLPPYLFSNATCVQNVMVSALGNTLLTLGQVVTMSVSGLDSVVNANARAFLMTSGVISRSSSINSRSILLPLAFAANSTAGSGNTTMPVTNITANGNVTGCVLNTGAMVQVMLTLPASAQIVPPSANYYLFVDPADGRQPSKGIRVSVSA